MNFWSCAMALVAVIHVAAAAADEPANQFPQPFDTQPLTLPLLSPQESLESFELPRGFAASVFAAEPDVQQPIAMAFDPRGRLWIGENFTYAEREVGYDRELRDRILILEDENQDGRYDKRTVFWDQGQLLTSIEIGLGGVWALCPPHLLFIPDKNKDDVPDGEPIVVLDGWEDRTARHNFVNGLRWGPDGWLYGRHGITSTSLVGRPGASPEKRLRVNCGIWRYHPVSQQLEMVCQGTTNPWGADWDEHGQLFFINTVIGHLWHAIPGAHFERMFGVGLNPHVYQLLGQTADHFHWDTQEKWSDLKREGLSETSDEAGGGHAHCGLMIYLGENWPRKYRGELFTLNLHGRRLNHDHLARSGATYTALHQPDLVKIGDPWFRGIDLTYGPDGGVFVLDWADIGECHENDGVHRSSGRIYKIVSELNTAVAGNPGDSGTSALSGGKARRRTDLSTLSSLQLARLQLVRNEWLVRQARQILRDRTVAGTDKKLPAAASLLKQAFLSEETSLPQKLRAMWCLYVMGRLDEPWLLARLEHKEEHIRVWAIRLLTDSGPPSPEVVNRMANLAVHETSGLVLTYLASALQRMAFADRWDLAEGILDHPQFAEDDVLPLMVWYGLEEAVAADPHQAAQLIGNSEMPLVNQFVARRVVHELPNRENVADPLIQLAMNESLTHVRQSILQGMSDGMRGWRKAKAPRDWDAAAKLFSRDPHPRVRELARDISVVFGDGRALEQLVAVAHDDQVSIDSRRSAIETLVDVRAPGLVSLLQELLKDRIVAPDAIRGLAAFDDSHTPDILLENYAKLDRNAQRAAISTLASRPDFARHLLAAVAEGTVDQQAVSVFELRQMQLFADHAIDARIRKLWPEFRLFAADKLERIFKYRQLLSSERQAGADTVRGQKLFQEACAKCHRLFGEGGQIGPDLTGAQRTNLSYLLENIVDPSASLVPEFRLSVLELEDGRIVSGVVTEETDSTIALQTPTDKLLIPRRAIVQSRLSDLSLMPEGLLDVFSDEEVVDLFAYLMSSR